MCIRVAQDEELQSRTRARCDAPAAAPGREALSPLLEVAVGVADAKGAALFLAADEQPILVGAIPQAGWPGIRRMSECVGAAQGGTRPDVELEGCGGLIRVTLRETPQAPAQRLVVWGVPPLAGTQRAKLLGAARALLAYLRTERQVRAAALNARRVQDVAYASGEWLWETDAQHRYTWVMRDPSRAPDGSCEPRVGGEIAQAHVVDCFGMPEVPGTTLREVLAECRPIVRLVAGESDGTRIRFVSRSAVPIVSADGGFLGYRGSARDVTDSVQAKAELWMRDEQLRRSAQALPGAVLHVGCGSWLSARIEDHSGRLAELLGLPGALRSYPLRGALRKLPAAERARLHKVARLGVPTLFLRLRTLCTPPAAGWIELHATANRKAGGATSWSVFIADSTQRVRDEQALRAHEQRWALAAGAAGLGLIEIDLVAGCATFDERSAALIGMSNCAAGRQAPLHDLLERLDAEGRAQLVERLADPLADASALSLELDGGRHLNMLVCPPEPSNPAGGRLTVICRDTTSEHQIGQLRLAKEAAEAASRAKSMLVSKVGHELRTPLNAIVGLSQLIRLKRDGLQEVAPVDGWVEQIASTGRHMAGVIETLMQLGQSGAGRLQIAEQSFDVREPMEEARRILEQEAAQRGVVIEADAALQVMVLADRRAVRQVFLNLLSNAIKYNREGGSVRVVVQDGARVRITVHDTGPGLSAEQRLRLFQPFERLGVESSRVEGYGLGLLVCKELLAAMDGTIDAESVPGAGCAFIVTLPGVAECAASPTKAESDVG